MSAGRANSRLADIQHKVQEERQRRGDDGYNDHHVRQLAVYLTMEEIDLKDLSAASESFKIATAIGLSVDQYLGAVAWVDPEHAAMLRRSLS
jgi:hypothetical protein